MVVRAISGGLVGAFFGAFLVVIASVATVAMSFFTESTMGIPYMIESSFKEVGGLPELHFTPDFPGMLGLVVLFGIAAMVYTLAKGRPRHKSGMSQ